MKILITYDVTRRHPEVKKELKTKGFLDNWQASGKIYSLPNTTLWHPNLASTEEAKTIFHEVIKKLNLNQPVINTIRIERFIAVPCEVWSGIQGDPHAE